MVQEWESLGALAWSWLLVAGRVLRCSVLLAGSVPCEEEHSRELLCLPQAHAA